MVSYGFRAEAFGLALINVHWHGDCWHFGHLLLYLLMAAFSRSIPVMLARDASHAMTSANSFAVASLSEPFSASFNSSISSSSQLSVFSTPRLESLWKYSCFIISWNS